MPMKFLVLGDGGYFGLGGEGLLYFYGAYYIFMGAGNFLTKTKRFALTKVTNMGQVSLTQQHPLLKHWFHHPEPSKDPRVGRCYVSSKHCVQDALSPQALASCSTSHDCRAVCEHVGLKLCA